MCFIVSEYCASKSMIKTPTFLFLLIASSITKCSITVLSFPPEKEM